MKYYPIFIYTIVFQCLFSQSPLSERYHTFYEIEQKLHEWESEFSANGTPWPIHYPDSGIIYQLYEIGRSGTDDLPIYVDERIMELDWIILGGGGRDTKFKTSPQIFHKLKATIIENLAL